MEMINQTQIDDMKHALGIYYKEKFVREKSYRNYYCDYEVNDSWEDLIRKGLASLVVRELDGKKYYYYHVTEKGMRKLETEEKNE